MNAPRRRREAAAPWSGWAALLVLLAIATWLRFAGIGFGLPGKYRPDEEFTVSCSLRIFGGQPNPHFFTYPTLYMNLLAAVYGVWQRIGTWLGSFGAAGFQAFVQANGGAAAHLAARMTTAAAGVLGVLATYRLGRLAAGTRVGIVAALLLTFSYAHVRESHFATADVLLTLLATLALGAIMRVSETGRWRDSIVAGMLAGLAFSTKYPGLALLVPLVLAHAVPWRRGALARGGIAVLAMTAAFAAGSPYVFLDWKSFRGALEREASFGGGVAGLDAPYGFSWLFGFALRYAAGIPVLAVGLIGAGWIVRDLFGGGPARPGAAILVSFVVAYTTPFLTYHLVYIRYVLPLLPILVVCAARAIEAAAQRMSPTRAVSIAVAIAALLSVEPALRAWRTDRLLQGPDTRNQAREWIATHVPSGASIAASTSYWYAKPELPPGYRYVDFAHPRAAAAEWALVDEHPVRYFSPPPPPAAAQRLASTGELVADFNPFVPGREAEAVFDPADAFYVPLAGQAAVRAAGPSIRIYRLAPVQ